MRSFAPCWVNKSNPIKSCDRSLYPCNAIDRSMFMEYIVHCTLIKMGVFASRDMSRTLLVWSLIGITEAFLASPRMSETRSIRSVQVKKLTSSVALSSSVGEYVCEITFNFFKSPLPRKSRVNSTGSVAWCSCKCRRSAWSRASYGGDLTKN